MLPDARGLHHRLDRRAQCAAFGEGRFGLDRLHRIYIVEFLRQFAASKAMESARRALGVCQPGRAAFLHPRAMMAEDDDPARFAKLDLILMGSPIDTRISPTEPNRLAESRARLTWFRDNVISTVPWPHSGFLAPRLSWLPAALGLHGDEPRPAYGRAYQAVSQPRPRRRRLRRGASQIL